MSQNIDLTYSQATTEFKEICSNHLSVSPDEIRRKRVPSLEKPHPVTGEPIKVKWEPEDSICFAFEEDLYQFPSIARNIPNVTLIPGLGLDFQTATLAYIPRKNGTNLDRYMLRQRFDFNANPHATGEWDKREITDIIFGIKDSGKAIDRMEVEKKRTSLKLQQSIRAIKSANIDKLGDHDSIMALSAGKLRSGAMTALSRSAFFGLHFMPETGIGVDYQLSVDYCRNSRPTLTDENGNIVVDGNRFEGEFEAFGTYSNRKLSEDERVDAIKTSLAHMRNSIIKESSKREIRLIETAANKAEFARAQVDVSYGLERAKEDNVKAEDYERQPRYGSLVRLFEGEPRQGLVAIPNATEMREYASIPLAERHVA